MGRNNDPSNTDKEIRWAVERIYQQWSEERQNTNCRGQWRLSVWSKPTVAQNKWWLWQCIVLHCIWGCIVNWRVVSHTLHVCTQQWVAKKHTNKQLFQQDNASSNTAHMIWETYTRVQDVSMARSQSNWRSVWCAGPKSLIHGCSTLQPAGVLLTFWCQIPQDTFRGVVKSMSRLVSSFWQHTEDQQHI